ncbi:MAG: ABC transporter substrate-binding protein [Pseudomonadota bacterium]
MSRVTVAGGSITEIIYALGLEGSLVAVDRTSNFPAAARELPSVGYVRNLSVEGLMSLNPTLILGEDDMGPPPVMRQLKATRIELRQLGEDHTADGIIAKVRCVATIMNAAAKGEAFIQQTLMPTVEALATLKASGRRTVLLFGLRDGAPMVGGANTSAHGLISMAGGANVFGQIKGWKPVSLEAMAKADPEVIVMPERGVRAAGGVDKVLAHPAVRLTTAARNNSVVTMDGMSMLGFGPRTLKSALMLAEQLRELP